MKTSWNIARGFYRLHSAAILAAGPNNWGIDPYEWDPAGIVLTPIEELFWHDIRAEGVVLYPQYPVGRYFVDFANPAAKVAIECDGAAFHSSDEQRARDQARQSDIEAMGWTVYRLTGSQCVQPDETTETRGESKRFILNHGRQLLRAICARTDIHYGNRRA